MKLAALVSGALLLAGCQVPVDTHGVASRQAGRCELMANQEDRGHIAFGLVPMLIAAHDANQRRQDVYDACMEAGGDRESPAETLPLPAAAAAVN